MTFALGRLFAPDLRDLDYMITPRLAAAPPPLTRRYWNANGWWGDQGQSSMCVAFAWVHFLEDGPVTQRGEGPIINPRALYDAAQLVDEWPGEAYDGTSVRAGAKVLQTRGFVSAYRWAFTVEDVARTILELGPMVVGTNWYTGMFEPDEAGFISPEGSVAGGHAYKIDGVNTRSAIFRIKNSWGRGWGHRGSALISFEDFARLLREDGEACIAEEVKL